MIQEIVIQLFIRRCSTFLKERKNILWLGHEKRDGLFVVLPFFQERNEFPVKWITENQGYLKGRGIDRNN